MTQQTIIDPNDGLPHQPIEKLTVNTVRTLSTDAVQAALSRRSVADICGALEVVADCSG
jgi:hypothetical protein